MLFYSELKKILFKEGVSFIHCVDISELPEKQNMGFPSALLIGISLSPNFIKVVSNTPHYVEKMKRLNKIKEDEFHNQEIKTDELADFAAKFLSSKGYTAYSQSEANILAKGNYNAKTKSTPFPHKTIAGLAGIGWIGKHNLLVTKEFGSALSMCSVLTDAPLKTVQHKFSESLCGDCRICEDNCSVNALKGTFWTIETSRDELVDISKCNTCLECMVFCPWTQKYMKKNCEILGTE